jgi:hypothetical protein
MLRKPGWVPLCKLEGRPDRLATGIRSRRVCAGRPTEVCIRLTTSKGHDGQARPAAGSRVVRQSWGHDRALTTRIEPTGNQRGAPAACEPHCPAGYSARERERNFRPRDALYYRREHQTCFRQGQPWLPGPDKPRCARAVSFERGGGPKKTRKGISRGQNQMAPGSRQSRAVPGAPTSPVIPRGGSGRPTIAVRRA